MGKGRGRGVVGEGGNELNRRREAVRRPGTLEATLIMGYDKV